MLDAKTEKRLQKKNTRAPRCNLSVHAASKITTMQTKETELIKRTVAGDTEAFALLADRYSRSVYSLVARIAGSAEDAEELTQDVFLKAFDALGRFDGRSAFATWLYRIACNTALSHVRRRRIPSCPVDERRLAALPDDEAERLEEIVVRERRLEALGRSVEMLEAEERALVTLFYYEERPISECAAVLDLTECNVKVRLHRTRKKLYLLVTELIDGKE